MQRPSGCSGEGPSSSAPRKDKGSCGPGRLRQARTLLSTARRLTCRVGMTARRRVAAAPMAWRARASKCRLRQPSCTIASASRFLAPSTSPPTVCSSLERSFELHRTRAGGQPPPRTHTAEHTHTAARILTVNGTCRAADRFCSARRCPQPWPPEGLASTVQLAHLLYSSHGLTAVQERCSRSTHLGVKPYT